MWGQAAHARSLADALLEPADLGGDVGFADAQDLGDLAVTVVFEVEQEQGAVHRVESGDEALQHVQALPRFDVDALFVGQVVQAVVERYGPPPARAFTAQPGDRHVQGDPVHPGRERPLRVIAREGAPQLRGDVLGEVGAVLGVVGIGRGDLEDDAAMGLEQGLELLPGVRRHAGRVLHCDTVRCLVDCMIRRQGRIVTASYSM